jgi:hypothetical protein
MSSVRKDIKECERTICPFYKYRPYQENPWKTRTRTTELILAHKNALRSGHKSSISPTCLSKVINIPKSTSGRCKIKIEIQPENEK